AWSSPNSPASTRRSLATTAPATKKPCARSATAPCATSALLRAWSKRHRLPVALAVLLEKEPAGDCRLLRARVVFQQIVVQLRAGGAPATKLDAVVMQHGADAHFVKHAAVPLAAAAVEPLERDQRVRGEERLLENLLHGRPGDLDVRLAVAAAGCVRGRYQHQRQADKRGRAQDSAHDRAHHQTRRDRPNRHDRDIAEFPRFAKRANAAALIMSYG